MKLHHIGIATKNIKKTLSWIKTNLEIISVSDEIYDEKQKAHLQIIQTKDIAIELISGEMVANLVQKNITYYHMCYEVDDIYKTIDNMAGSVVIKKPTEAILFENRLVAFLITPMGLVELLESKKADQ